MSYNELNKLSHEDVLLFEERLTAFFKTSVADSYTQLRLHLETCIPRSRFSDCDSLIDDCITRLITKVVEFERRGEPVNDLKKFVSRIASFIILEYGRRKDRHVHIEPDPAADPELPFRRPELRYSPDHEIGAIRREIELDCMTACLEQVSQEKQKLLFSYYPTDPITPKQRKEIREKLALNEAGETASETPNRKVNNLQVQVSKTRSKLKKCFHTCIEANLSRHHKLMFLGAQQT